MTSMTAKQATFRPRDLRSTVQSGEDVALTFHGKPYGYVVPANEYEAFKAWKDAREQQQEACMS